MQNTELSSKEAAKLLGISDARIRQYILGGRLRARKFAGVWIIDRKDFISFRKEHAKRTAKRAPKQQQDVATTN